MSTKRQKADNINFWAMMRDVLIASMNKGQFPIALVAFVFIIMILKMPAKDVSKLVFDIFDAVKIKVYLGYIFAGVLLILWFIHTKLQRSFFSKEIERISEERNKLQEKLLGDKVASSKGR